MASEKKIFWIAVWCAALIVTWSVGRSDAVQKALVLFFAAGVVPGTRIVLSPEAALLCTIVVMSVLVALMFNQQIARLVRRGPQQHPLPPVLPEPVAVLPARQGQPSHALAALRAVALHILLAITTVTIIAGEYATRAWRWLEPQLRRFDRFIERTLKRNPRIAAILAVLEGQPRPVGHHQQKTER